MVDEKVKENIDFESIYDYQEKILASMTNNYEKIYDELKINQINVNEYEYIIENNEDIYVYIQASYSKEPNYSIYVNDQLIRNSSNYTYDIDNTLKLSGRLENNYEKGEKLNIKIIDDNSLNNIKIKLYNYDYNNFLIKIDQLKNKQLNLTQFSENYIKGTIDGEGILFLSIPYSENWKIYVDGVETDTYKLFDMFLGVDISAGMHNIELKYEISTFKYGIIISCISICIFIVYNKKH